jgi:hypothetical protein
MMGFKPLILGWSVNCSTSVLPCHNHKLPFSQFSIYHCHWQDSNSQSLDDESSLVPMCYCGTIKSYISSFFCIFLSPCASGRIQTLYIRIMSQVFYHRATMAPSKFNIFLFSGFFSHITHGGIQTLYLRMLNQVPPLCYHNFPFFAKLVRFKPSILGCWVHYSINMLLVRSYTTVLL